MLSLLFFLYIIRMTEIPYICISVINKLHVSSTMITIRGSNYVVTMNTSNDVPCILPNGKMPVLNEVIHILSKIIACIPPPKSKILRRGYYCKLLVKRYTNTLTHINFLELLYSILYQHIDKCKNK